MMYVICAIHTIWDNGEAAIDIETVQSRTDLSQVKRSWHRRMGWNLGKGLRRNVEPSTHATAGQNKELQIQDARQRGPRESYEPFIATEPSHSACESITKGVAPRAAPRAAPRGILENAEFPTYEAMKLSPNEPSGATAYERIWVSPVTHAAYHLVRQRRSLSKDPLWGRRSGRSIPGPSNEASTPGRIGSIEDLFSVSGPDQGTSRCHRPRFNSMN